jgi:hypothetical protein
MAAPTSLLPRLIAAVPDAITAGFFLTVWIAPLWLGEGGVRTAMLIMLVEFLVVHASGFLGAIALASTVSRRKRLLALLGFGLFYALFIGAFMLAFKAWWPAAVFGWLLVGKFARVLTRVDDHAAQRQMAAWGASVLFYILGVFLTLFLPLPRLGIDAATIPRLGLVGEGAWIDEPHRVVAFGVVYFAALAWYKWLDPAGPSNLRRDTS